MDIETREYKQGEVLFLKYLGMDVNDLFMFVDRQNKCFISDAVECGGTDRCDDVGLVENDCVLVSFRYDALIEQNITGYANTDIDILSVTVDTARFTVHIFDILQIIGNKEKTEEQQSIWEVVKE